mmetsp:Transcript_26694/g.53617  ORF Transcript_26694/g.53617 Transcript_26694/m.53617 type:complete len:109 (+) Transcript_26694:602-928(+)
MLIAMAAASVVRMEKEATDLKEKNKVASSRLKSMKPKVDMAAFPEKSRQKYADNDGWVDPYVFQSKFAEDPTRRHPDDPPAPSWLSRHEKYGWSVDPPEARPYTAKVA